MAAQEARVLSFTDYAERHGVYLPQVTVYPLQLGKMGELPFVLVPIELTTANFGVLVAQDYHPSSRTSPPTVSHADYVRVTESGRQVLRFHFPSVRFRRWNEVVVAETDIRQVLPLPSRHPYIACEMTPDDYSTIQSTISTVSQRRDGLETIVRLLAERTELSRVATGYFWLKRHRLVPQEGYADALADWYGSPNRFSIL